jgi:integrase
MQSVPLLDCAGRRRSPATRSSFHQGLPPRNKGLRYPPDPPTVEEIIAVMHAAGDDPDGLRLRGTIVVLWRAGLRISEALALTETDLDPERGALLVRHGKGGKRREVGMDRWGWTQLGPWLELRTRLPVGALFCVLRGPTRGRPCAPAGIRGQLHGAAQAAGVRRRFAPHQLRHAHAVEMSPRRRAVARDPAPARSRRPGHHIRVSPRDRQHRDHPRGPRTTRPDDPGQHPARDPPLNPLARPRNPALRPRPAPRPHGPRPALSPRHGASPKESLAGGRRTCECDRPQHWASALGAPPCVRRAR